MLSTKKKKVLYCSLHSQSEWFIFNYENGKMANTKIYTDEMEAVKAFVHNVNELAKNK